MSNLITFYKKGYFDEKNGSSSIESNNLDERMAYHLGAVLSMQHFDVDYLNNVTEDQIQKEIDCIKNIKKN